MDLVRPVTESIHGNRYFLTIIDDFSRYGWVLFIENKSDVFDKFFQWYNEIKNIFNKLIKFIRSDNGTEFSNSKFKNFCSINGIVHQFTIPYNPQQNGHAERLNGTLISSTKALLNDSKLGREFWEYAVDTANYIHNRIPHAGINYKIPYEILFKTKVDYSHFKVFGCRVFFYIPKTLRNKFDNNASPGIFLGYHPYSPAYKILNLSNNKIILSQSVEFFEENPGNSKISTIIPYSNYNFIPNSEIRGSDLPFIKKNPFTNQYTKEFYNTPNNHNTDNNISINNAINNNNYENINTTNNNNNNNNNTKNNITNKINNNIDNNSRNNNDTHDNKNVNIITSKNNNNSDISTNNKTTEKIKNNNYNFLTHNNNRQITDDPITSNNNINIESSIINKSNNLKNKTKKQTSSDDYNDSNNKNKKQITCKNSNTLNNTKRKLENNNPNNPYHDNKIKSYPEHKLREPKDFNDIYNLQDKDEWLEAVNEELGNMKELNVYTEIEYIPKNANVVSCRWVFKYKKDENGKIQKRKARLVARGFSQQYGIDYTFTFSPTLKLDSLRIIIAIAVQKNFKIIQIDINSAYLNAELNEDIYMEAPKGFSKNVNKIYWKLNKALYGLKQAGREWNNKLDQTLVMMKFKRLVSEPCLYIKENEEKKITCILAVYVDDILLAGNDKEIFKVKEEIKRSFNIKEIREVDFLIGIKFQKCSDGYIIHQRGYIRDLLNKYNILKYKPIRNIKPVEDEVSRKIIFNEKQYRGAIGNLLYLAICTRPDILYAVSRAARKNNNPTLEDWKSLMKILRYLRTTENYGIKFSKDRTLKVYADADYAGDLESRKSTSGFIIKIGSSPTSWYSKLQHCVATSTAESEYYSVSDCSKHSLWYLNLLNELNINLSYIIINVDNKAAIYNCQNQSINPRSKHIDIKYHHIRDLVKRNKIKLKYIESEENIADGFTKYLNNTLMDRFRNSLLVKIEN